MLAGTYGLDVVNAGRFGLLVTLVSIFVFVLGFERQIDLQRVLTGAPVVVVVLRIRETLRFYLANYTVGLPICALILFSLLKLPPLLIAGTIIIIISEHLAQQTYLLVLVDYRYHRLLYVVITKNVCLLVLVMGKLAIDHHLTLEFIIGAWIAASFLCIAFLIAEWQWRNRNVPRIPSERIFFLELPRQYGRSHIHFLIGLVALLALQADRVIVGSLLSPIEVGIYFRNITLVSLAYQVFNVVSFNRLSPRVYAQAATARFSQLRRMTHREHLRITVLCVAGYCVLWTLNHFNVTNLFHKFHIDLNFQAIFLLTFLLRAGGDFDGLLLNSRTLEKKLLLHQTMAVGLGLALSSLCTWRFGLYGTVLAGVVPPLVYWMANRKITSRIED